MNPIIDGAGTPDAKTVRTPASVFHGSKVVKSIRLSLIPKSIKTIDFINDFLILWYHGKENRLS
jgi:hypothetical protein